MASAGQTSTPRRGLSPPRNDGGTTVFLDPNTEALDIKVGVVQTNPDFIVALGNVNVNADPENAVGHAGSGCS
eukprot:tig00020952_g16478.t1